MRDEDNQAIELGPNLKEMRRYESQPASEVPNMTLGNTRNGIMNASYEKADFDLFVGFRSATLQIS